LHGRNKEDLFMTLLLSLLPPSCIVAPIRELVNTWNPTASKETKINSMVQNNSNMDIDINIPRGRSASSSTNSSRVSSAYLGLSSILYYKRMEVQSSKLTWDMRQTSKSQWEKGFLLIISYPQGRGKQTG